MDPGPSYHNPLPSGVNSTTGTLEVLGPDSNRETSDYTNSVDLGSLGCVIYELLVGTKLFGVEGQVTYPVAIS